MALQYAFRLGSFTFAATLLCGALEKVSFVSGLQDAILVGLVFLGIGFAIGELSRHIVEELAVREFALANLPAETGVKDTESLQTPTAN